MFVAIPGGGAFGGVDVADQFCQQTAAKSTHAAIKQVLQQGRSFRAVLSIDGTALSINQRVSSGDTSCVERVDGVVRLYV
jgi:hypothetical protein